VLSELAVFCCHGNYHCCVPRKRESTATGKVVNEVNHNLVCPVIMVIYFVKFFSKVIAMETINMSGCRLTAEATT